MTIEERFAAIREVEPGAEDLAAIERIRKRNDTSEGITLEEMDAIRERIEYKLAQ